MTNDKELLQQQIDEQKALLSNSNDLKVQKKAISQLQKLERRLAVLKEGKDPSNNNGRLGGLALGLALAPFTGGSSLVIAGLHVAASVIGEEYVLGTDTYTTPKEKVSPEDTAKAEEIARLKAQLAELENN